MTSIPTALRIARRGVLAALALLVGAGSAVAAGSPMVSWAAKAGGTTGADFAYATEVSALPDGSSIVTGYFEGTAMFGSTTLASAGNTDVFTAKMNADGTWAWAARAGGTSEDKAEGVSALPDGSSIITGYIAGTATFGSTTLTSTGSADVFTAKMNADGTWAWAARAGGAPGQQARGFGVAAFPDGSSIVTGYFDGTATFGSTTLTSTGNNEAFTAKMNANGTWAWAARVAGGAGADNRGADVSALPDGSSIVTGEFDGSATFGSTTLTSASGDFEAFAARMNADGTWAWAARAGGGGTQSARNVSALPDGSSIVTGHFQGTATFGSTTLTTVPGDKDVFTAKLNANGTWAWAAWAGGAGTGAESETGGVSALPDGSSMVTGEFEDTATFGSTTLTSAGSYDVFTAKMNADGTWAWATRAGDATSDGGLGVSALPDGSSIVTGNFTGTATFGGSTLTSAGAAVDAFGARYLDAPQAPSAPVAVAGEQSATVSISPLAGGSVTSYTVTSSPAGRTCTIAPPATRCTVSALAGGTSYTFTATATNAAGTSQASPRSNAVTPTAPGARKATLTATLLPSRRRVASREQMRIGIRARNSGGQVARAVTSCVRLPLNIALVRRPVQSARSGRTVCVRQGTIAGRSQKTSVITVRAVTTRQVTRTITGSTRATGLARVSAPPRAVQISPLAVGMPVTG